MTEASTNPGIFFDKASDDLAFIKKQLVNGASAAQRNGQPKIAELLFTAADIALKSSTATGKEKTILDLKIYYSKFLIEQGKHGKARRIAQEAIVLAKSSALAAFDIALATNNYAAACRRGRTKKLQEEARNSYLEVLSVLETIREIPTEKYMQNCLMLFDRAATFFKEKGDESSAEQVNLRAEAFKNAFQRLPENTLFVRRESHKQQQTQ